MSSTWELSTDAGVNWVTFASLSLNSAKRTLVAFDLDRFTFRGPAALALTADLPTGFAYGSTIIIRLNDGATNPLWFYGRMGTAPRIATGAEESVQYTLDGPWWYLQRCMYQQSWKVYSSGGGGGIVDANKARVILSQSAAGARIDSGAQITDAIDWAIARGAPIAKGTIDAGCELPFDERVNISCAEVIQTMLRYTPDVVPWFDYTTSPYPTFHCRKRANLTAVSKAITALSALNPITPRNDLQVPGVTISYEKLNAWDESTYQTIELDTAGDVNAIDSVFCAFELQGSTATFVKQDIVVEAFPNTAGVIDWNNKTWWKKMVPDLTKIADADLTITDGGRFNVNETLVRYLTKGTLHDWLNVSAEEQDIWCHVSGPIRDDSGTIVQELREAHVGVKVIATSATTRTYSHMASYDAGEATPSGVAAALYAAWNTLHYQGTCRTVETEVAGTLVPGSKLNLTGGRTEWATMAAMIIETEEDIDSGVTTARFGPPARIEADSLVALLRALRTRMVPVNLLTRTTGQVGGQNTITFSGFNPVIKPSSYHGEMAVALLRQEDGDANTQSIHVKPSLVAFADAADKAETTIQPREVLVPELDGSDIVFKRRQILASASYHAAVPLAASASGNPYSFQFTKTSTTGGTLAHGRVYIKGVALTYSGWTNHSSGADLTISGITTTTYFYWLIDLAAASAAWTSNTTGFPSPTSNVYPWPILTLTCAGSVITAIKEHRDVHLPGNV